MGSFLDIYLQRKLIFTMVKRDFKNRYAGSLLGVFWSVAQPLFMMGIMWAVFTFGLKAQSSTGGLPFLPWLFAGLIVWNFFSEGLVLSSNSILDYSFLVKKVNFKLHLIPCVRILSASILHLVFLGIVVFLLCLYGYWPRPSWLMISYYIVCHFMLLLGLSMISSVLIVFVKDLSQIIQILLQVGFWGTPIIWNLSQIPEKYQIFFLWNPVYYIVSGYRQSLFGIENGFPALMETTLFWSIVFILNILGQYLFRKLRPSIADVL